MAMQQQATPSSPRPLTAAEVVALRPDFPILERRGRGGQPIAYLDSAATSQKPRQVIAAQTEFLERHNGAVNRGTHLLGDEATQAFEDARLAVASFLGADSEELVWTRNATDGINLLAYAIGNATLGRPGGRGWESLALRPGQKICVTRAEHHANLLPWQELCARTNTELTWLDLLPDGRIDLETLDRIDAQTAVVAFTHVSNVTGAISPVAEIVAQARAVGALVVLDASQSAPHMPIDFAQLGVDFAVVTAHKMVGPTGIGALLGRAELLEALPPVQTGGSMIANVTMTDATWLPAPQRFEAGTQAVAEAVAWHAAVDYLSRIGMERIAAYEEQLTGQLLAGLAKIPGLELLGPVDSAHRLGVAAFVLPDLHPHDIGQVLDGADVAVRVGHHCAIPLHRFFQQRSSTRASVSFTTTSAELERLFAGIETVLDFFGKVSK